MLGAFMLPVVFLAEQLAHPVDYFIEDLQVPAALGGVVIALLVATPEGIGAVKAAAANHLQRSINIFLGSVLSTIGLTVPGDARHQPPHAAARSCSASSTRRW